MPFRRRQWMAWAAAAAVALIVVALLVREPKTSKTTDSPTTATIAEKPALPDVTSMVVTVTLATSRSSSNETEIVLHDDVDAVELHVRLHPDDRFDRYAMRLDSATSTVWTAENLTAREVNGELIVAGSVPATLLHEGSYELAVSGDGEDLGFVTLEARRRK